MTLKEYLRIKFLSGNSFSKLKGISRGTVYKALSDPNAEFYPQTAQKFYEATEGKVKVRQKGD